MSREVLQQQRRYYSIIEGSFRAQVPRTTPGAVMREWKSTDGKEGIKYERVVRAVIGYIEQIRFYETEYGTKIEISLDRDRDGSVPTVSLAAASREGEDFLKKLPNIDLAKEVSMRPFAFTGNDDEAVRGMEIMQPDAGGEFQAKVVNFFRDFEKKENINGFPTPEGDTERFSKDDWKIYFLQTRRFLINYATEHILPRIDDLPKHVPENVKPPRSYEEQVERLKEHANGGKTEEGIKYPDDNINPDDIPF